MLLRYILITVFVVLKFIIIIIIIMWPTFKIESDGLLTATGDFGWCDEKQESCGVGRLRQDNPGYTANQNAERD